MDAPSSASAQELHTSGRTVKQRRAAAHSEGDVSGARTASADGGGQAQSTADSAALAPASSSRAAAAPAPSAGSDQHAQHTGTRQVSGRSPVMECTQQRLRACGMLSVWCTSRYVLHALMATTSATRRTRRTASTSMCTTPR